MKKNSEKISHILNADEEVICQSLRALHLNKSFDSDEVVLLIVEALRSLSPRLRRYAAVAAGKQVALNEKQKEELEESLLSAWQKTNFANEKRHIAEALGKIGGSKAQTLLESSEAEDLLLTKSIAKALLFFERRSLSQQKTTWNLQNSFPGTLAVRLWCRHGLEEMMLKQLDLQKETLTVLRSGLGWVDVNLRGSPELLYRNRFFLKFSFKMSLPKSSQGTEAKAIAGCLFTSEAREIFEKFSTAPYRVRFEHMSLGHQRALQWQTAEEISAKAKENSFPILNDPRQADWEAHIASHDSTLFLSPKTYPDPRFFYRLQDVPAASHPTLAAALAHLAGVKADDKVWDPFVGSGSELIERHLLGPYQILIGSDLDAKALASAKANIECAGLLKADRQPKVLLVQSDALKYETKVSLVLTNPPMGRRVKHHDAEKILVAFVNRLPKILEAGGRLVWISPFPEVLDPILLRNGFSKSFSVKVDMGGFAAEMQKWKK